MNSSIMRSNLWPALGAVLLLSLVGSSLAQAQGKKIYQSISANELKSILESEGYATARIDRDGDVEVRIQGTVAYFILSDDADSVQFYCGWEEPDVGLDKVNEWNRTKRYSRAYLDKESHPILELDLDLVGGVTLDRIKDFISTAKISLIAFEREVL